MNFGSETGNDNNDNDIDEYGQEANGRMIRAGFVEATQPRGLMLPLITPFRKVSSYFKTFTNPLYRLC